MSFSFARPTFTTSAEEEKARIGAAISQASLFCTLSAEAVDDLARRASIKRVGARTTIVSQDEPGE